MLPSAARGKFLESPENIGLASSSDHKLSNHDRHAEEHDAYKVDDDESGATVGPHKIREPPEIAQTDGGTDQSQNHSKGTFERISFFCRHSTKLLEPARAIYTLARQKLTLFTWFLPLAGDELIVYIVFLIVLQRRCFCCFPLVFLYLREECVCFFRSG